MSLTERVLVVEYNPDKEKVIRRWNSSKSNLE